MSPHFRYAPRARVRDTMGILLYGEHFHQYQELDTITTRLHARRDGLQEHTKSLLRLNDIIGWQIQMWRTA